MADISKLTRLLDGLHQELDLTSNTLVLQNLKLNLGTAFNVTFAGTPTANRTITLPDSNVDLGDIANKADTDLSNLASTAINADLIPDVNNSRAIGSASLQWSAIRAGVFRSYDYASASSTGDITSGSNVITNVADTSAFQVDMILVGPGIPFRNFITAVGANSITLEQNATSTTVGATIAAQFETNFVSGPQSGNSTSSGFQFRTGNTANVRSGHLVIRTGNSSANDSGDIFLNTGSASGTRGRVRFSGSEISLEAPVTANNQLISDVADPVNDQDAATKAYVDTAIGASGEFADNVFRIQDNGDATKQIAFEASAITTATTRTITMPDANVNLADVNQAILQDGSRSMSANLNLNNNKITNLANGTNAGDAVNKAQLDAAIVGLDFQADVDDVVADASTTAPGSGLPAAATGQRYILQSGTGSLAGGWGAISGVGNNDIVQYNGSAWVVAYDVSVQGEGALVWDRDSNAFYKWDGSTWSEFGGLAGVTAGAGLDKTGNILFIELDTDAGLEFDTPGDAGKLRAKVDDSTIERHSTGLRVKDAGITAAKLNTNTADQDTITGGAGNAFAVQKAPAIRKTMVAGESFAANTTFLVRMARNGETAGRVYKADKDASTNHNFYVIGVVMSTSAVSAGGNIVVTMLGTHVLGSSDVAFAGADLGKPVFLTSSGAFSVTAPSTTNEAVTKVGMVENTDRIMVQIEVVGIN